MLGQLASFAKESSLACGDALLAEPAEVVIPPDSTLPKASPVGVWLSGFMAF